MKNTLRIGTVGTNFIVPRFIEAIRLAASDSPPGLSGSPSGLPAAPADAEIAAVYSRSAENAEAFAGKQGAALAFCDREAFLGSAGYNCVYVAAPNSLHYPWARDALLHGKSVICEKPFVSTGGELRDLIRLARERGLFLFEALPVSHLPNAARLRGLLDEIAPVRHVEMNFSKFSSRYPSFLEGENPNLFNPEFSGGALMDLNYYNLALTVYLFGEPEEIRYFPSSAVRGIDVSGTLILAYRGFNAVLSACKDSPGESFVQIQGERGHLYSPSTSSNLRGGITIHRNGAYRETGPARRPRDGVAEKPATEQFQDQDRENTLFYEARDFIESFVRGDPSCCFAPLEESLKYVSLTEKARKAAGILFPADKE
ncbi:MAG: Gfo/Idh/MocA family oxidoreductase [Treponema sp.]|jgi:predicted dehydrogenase|nr:Gfo/Idh/MocA family oxidoreductase [Treponema sp.]